MGQERDRERETGVKGREVEREGQGRAPHVSPKTVGRPRCYAMTHGPTNGHPNLLYCEEEGFGGRIYTRKDSKRDK